MTTNTKTKLIQPQKVRNIFCPNPSCKELMVKIYPWANFAISGEIKFCNKCVNESIKNTERSKISKR